MFLNILRISASNIRKTLLNIIEYCTVFVAILDVVQSRQNYSKCIGYCSTFNADNSAVIHRVLKKKRCLLKGIDMEII